MSQSTKEFMLQRKYKAIIKVAILAEYSPDQCITLMNTLNLETSQFTGDNWENFVDHYTTLAEFM